MRILKIVLRETVRAVYAALFIAVLASGIALASGVGGGIPPSPTFTGAVGVTGGNLTVNGSWGITVPAGIVAAGSDFAAIYGKAANAANVCGVLGAGVNSAGSAGVKGQGVGVGIGVWGVGTSSGVGVLAENSLGSIALQVSGDTTSPAVGQIRMPVLDTNPTSCQVGDMFMFTGGVLRVCTATTPTWVNVGAQ
jgi:hypothetical protein